MIIRTITDLPRWTNEPDTYIVTETHHQVRAAKIGDIVDYVAAEALKQVRSELKASTNKEGQDDE